MTHSASTLVSRGGFVIVALGLFVAGLTGCEDDVPAASADGGVFTLWGQLDPTAERQAVRVEPISPTLDGEPTLDASVVSVNLRTGEETAWRDSVITFPDGSVGHVFLADYNPEYEEPIEFRVLRGGEVATYARVTVPPRVSGIFGDPVVGARNTVDLLLPAAPRVVGPRVVYELVTPQGAVTEVVRMEDSGVLPMEHGWVLRVDFTSHVEVVRSRLFQRGIREFNATAIRVQGVVVNEEWAAPYPFPFSPDLLIQPGTVSNVRRGYGFVGAGYPVDLRWEVEEEVLNRIGL